MAISIVSTIWAEVLFIANRQWTIDVYTIIAKQSNTSAIVNPRESKNAVWYM